jgi:long-chain acyl-CoA synthetase
MSVNLGMILAAAAHEYPERTALYAERPMSYADLDRAARGVASALARVGVGPGDAVALLLPNVPEFTIAYFGALYTGAVVVPLNVLLAAPEIAYHLEDCGAKLLIAHALFETAASAGAAPRGVPIAWAGGSREPNLAQWRAEPPLASLAQRAESDTAVVLYTSGTTGKPKGAELTHSNLLLNCAMVVPRILDLRRDDVILAVLPLFHSFGQTCVQTAFLAVGACFSLQARFEPAAALAQMERDGVTIFAGVPTMYFALLQHSSGQPPQLPRLRTCVSGGAALPVDVLRSFEARFGVQILEGYGLSETSPVASFNMPSRPRRPGHIGYPVWGVEMSIRDEHGQPLPDGEPGEICIRGHNVMKGYLGRPEATREAIREGWFYSGDIGVRETDGSYRIVDRKKEMIIRGGFNVYPREVEEVLYAHPAVTEAAVIGVPDARYGEEVKAFVVLAPGESCAAEELIAYARENLAAYKYPRLVEFRAALPKGPTGKILKRELVAGAR